MFDPLQSLQELIRFPSVSTDTNYAEGMAGARGWLLQFLTAIGFEARLVETSRHAAVIAHRKVPGDAPHVIIYGHYDVQPPDPLEAWTTPPFEPEVRGGRLYARGAADNKGGLMVHLAAVRRLLEEDPDLPLNLTFLIEGEEEIGSPSLPEILAQCGEELRGDLLLLSDTMSPSPDCLGVTVALRGIVTLEIEVSGPSRDLHSGLFGGAVYNPVQALMELGASLHGPDGRVNVPGFYDDVVEVQDWERAEIRRLGQDTDALRTELGIPAFAPLGKLSPFEITRVLPTLEFNGVGGGYQGPGDKTIIPRRAFAKISCRLVANQDAATIFERVASTLRERCPSGVRLKITEGHHGPAYRVVPPGRPDTPADQNPVLARAFAAVESAAKEIFGAKPIYLREGGSIPIIGQLHSALGLDSLMMGVFLAEDRHHAPDESLHLDLFHKGIAVSERLLRTLARPS